MIEINLICPQTIPDIWQKIEPLITKAICYSSEYQYASDFYHSLASGFSGLFVISEGKDLLGVAIIQKAAFPHLSICHIKLASGEQLEKWLSDLNEAVYNWAAVNDCQLVRMYGRPGWKKFYKEQGWRMDKIIFSRPVIENTH